MKKQVAMFAVIGGVMSLLLVSCAKPKNDETDGYKKEQKKSGCGCQSSENILDLRGTTENPTDALTNPTVKL